MVPSSPQLDHYIGREIGNYRIESLLAAGGMGIVYRACHKTLPNLHQAIKVLAPAYAADPAARARFRREAAAAARVGSHHQIVRPIDAGEFSDGSLYMVMELVAGKSLQQELDLRESLPLRTAADIALLIADAMVFAHMRGITHRDLKPANIMLEQEGGTDRVKILDFGIAKAALSAPDQYATAAGISVGTIGYMSPEQTAGMPTDGRTDVFSWGVIFFQMLSGRLPFVAKDRKELHSQITSSTFPAPRINSIRDVEFDPVPPEIEDLIARALAKDVDDRPTMAAVRDDLHRIIASWIGETPFLRDAPGIVDLYRTTREKLDGPQGVAQVRLLPKGSTQPSEVSAPEHGTQPEGPALSSPRNDVLQDRRAEVRRSPRAPADVSWPGALKDPRRSKPAAPRHRLFATVAFVVLGVACLLISVWVGRSTARPNLAAQQWEGPWIYSIHNKYSNAHVYGAFILETSPSGVAIPSGQVWYVGDAPEPHLLRGTWKSKAASISESTLYVIFEMDSMTENKEAGGTRWYKGVLEMTRSGTGSLLGTFQDLGARHEHWGSVQAEHAHDASMTAAAQEAYQRFGRR